MEKMAINELRLVGEVKGSFFLGACVLEFDGGWRFALSPAQWQALRSWNGEGTFEDDSTRRLREALDEFA